MEKKQCPQCSFDIFCRNSELVDIGKKERLLKKGDTLRSVGDPFHCLYIVKSGALKACEVDGKGNELIDGFYLKNEAYGYEAIYKKRYFYTTIALSETIICEIAYADFLELLRTKPDLLSPILYLMSQQLCAGAYLKLVTAQQRIAAFLLDMFVRISGQQEILDKANFFLPITYQDMGNYLGLATETVSRVLSYFKKNKMIDIQHKKIYLLQSKLLKNIAEGL